MNFPLGGMNDRMTALSIHGVRKTLGTSDVKAGGMTPAGTEPHPQRFPSLIVRRHPTDLPTDPLTSATCSENGGHRHSRNSWNAPYTWLSRSQISIDPVARAGRHLGRLRSSPDRPAQRRRDHRDPPAAQQILTGDDGPVAPRTARSRTHPSPQARRAPSRPTAGTSRHRGPTATTRPR